MEMHIFKFLYIYNACVMQFEKKTERRCKELINLEYNKLSMKVKDQIARKIDVIHRNHLDVNCSS